MRTDFPSFLLSQLIPARGRKQSKCPCSYPIFRVTTYPREGTETSSLSYTSPVALVTTYPREGTETESADMDGQRGSHNLSPRGDGNAWTPTTKSAALVTTYPREGTETQKHVAPKIITPVTTYPREGTETFNSVIVTTSFLCHNLSPRGDGNIVFTFFSFNKLKSQLIPARGRLLLVSQQPFTFLSQLIPVRGQKKPFPKKRKGLSPVYITAKK